MSSYAQTMDEGIEKPESHLRNTIKKVCDRGYFLLTSFSLAMAANDIVEMEKVIGMAGKDVAKVVFAGNDPKHLDFLLEHK